jgi:hypothetical protein
MGSRFSQQNLCNYHCPVCKASGKTPNLAGRFFIINEYQCQCNACNTVFEKDLFYAQPNNPRNLDGKWSVAQSATQDNKYEVETQPDSVLTL